MPSQADLTAQWIITQEQIAQAEARLADLRADREHVEGELHKLLGEGGSGRSTMVGYAAHLQGQLRLPRLKRHRPCSREASVGGNVKAPTPLLRGRGVWSGGE